MSRLSTKPLGRIVSAVAVVGLLGVAACSRLHVAAGPSTGTVLPPEAPLSVVYLVGDFGKPGAALRDLTAAMADDAAGVSGLGLRTPPIILELGDNLYEDGLPHDLEASGAAAEVDKLAAIAAAFAGVRYAGSQVPLVLVPGNHDYRNDALALDGNLGDITRWYFLDELGVAGTERWTQVPGDASGFASAAALFDHIDGDADAHARFMRPAQVPGTDAEIAIIAIDSELLLSLYDVGRGDLADAYFAELGETLDAAPARSWRIVAAHHPPVTYGKHGEPSFGNWIFGQGWPQFPKTWQKIVAAAIPLGIVGGIVVNPAFALIAAAPPVNTVLATGRKQDVNSDPYRRYAEKLLEIAAAQRVDAIVAGHDHNTQLIDLSAVTNGANGAGSEALLAITGAGSKVDPVRRGPGMIAFAADYSWLRLLQYDDGLVLEIRGRHGELYLRHGFGR